MRFQYPAVTAEKGNGKNRSRAIFLTTTAFALLCGGMEAPAQTRTAQTADQSTASQAARVPFDIPAQPLASAVGAFGRQSGLQVTLCSTQAGAVRTNAVIGSFTPAEALARMLAGTGLVIVTRGADGAIAMTRAGMTEVAAPRTHVADTVGAGDSFMAALLASLRRSGLLGPGLRDALAQTPPELRPAPVESGIVALAA